MLNFIRLCFLKGTPKDKNMTTRAELYRLIDTLPDSELSAVHRFLNDMHSRTDPVLKALSNAPDEDEMMTEQEERLVQEAREEVARNEISAWDDVKLRLRGQQ
jgi:hypothetical protein